MLQIIVNKEEFLYRKNCKVTLDEQLKEIVKILIESNPTYHNLYKSPVKDDCWHLFRPELTVNEISNATGCTPYTIKSRIYGTKLYDNLPATKKNGRLYVKFEDFKNWDHRPRIIESKRAQRYSFILDGKEKVISSYLDDKLSINAIAKALGVSRNTLVTFIDRKMPAASDMLFIEKVQDMIDAGQSFKEIAQNHNIKVKDLNTLCIKGRLSKPQSTEGKTAPQYAILSKEDRIKIITCFFNEGMSLAKIAKMVGANHITIMRFCEKNIPHLALQIALKRQKKKIVRDFDSGISPQNIARKYNISLEDLRIFAHKNCRKITEDMSLVGKEQKITNYLKQNITLAVIAKALDVKQIILKNFIKREMSDLISD